MLRLKENSKKSPPGGHHYPEYGVTFRGESCLDVIEKVRNFRLHNAISLGNPEQDVLNFYADNWPWLVKEDTESPPPEPNPDQFDKWREWISQTWKNPPKKLVTPKEAKDRWAICAACPFNEQFKFSESDESAELTRRAFLLRRGIETSKEVSFCACHNTDLGAFSFFDAARDFSHQKDKKQPPSCWV